MRSSTLWLALFLLVACVVLVTIFDAWSWPAVLFIGVGVGSVLLRSLTIGTGGGRRLRER